MAGRRQRDERGATAVLFALLATVLLGVSALAVDIGQAYAKKSLLQTDVDLAVLAAAVKLDQPDRCNPEVEAKAVEFLTKAENAVPGQYPVDLGGSPGDEDGFIRCQDWKVELWAPRSHVEFGLGKVVSDQDGLDVAAHATAWVRSPVKPATLPFFAASGCDIGAQSIRNDSGGSTPSTPPVPPLVPDSVTHTDADFTIDLDTVAAGATSQSLKLTGTNLGGVTAVGFTTAAGDHVEVPVTTVDKKQSQSVTLAVPSIVLEGEDRWYVRTRSGSTWSSPADAQTFTVGEPRLYCDASNAGNFGTLDIPRTSGGSSLELNMILGIEASLAIHPTPPVGTCDGKPGSVMSRNKPLAGTNCVTTEPGLKVSATNAGLVTGSAGHRGRLDAESTGQCSRGGSSSRTTKTIKGVHLNDDLLTCFIVNNAHISDLVAGNVVGTRALSADIFRSPRFFWIPILGSDPTTGRKAWPIIGFRPGFITDQSLSATRAAPGTISDFNGLEVEPSGIREVRVVLFDEAALPETAPATGNETDYTGSGTKVPVLVD